MQKSLVLIKPDAVKKNLIGNIISMYEKEDLKVVALKMQKINKHFAKLHYKEHIGKDFFNDLVKFITKDNLCALILEGDNAISKIRNINGATDPSKAVKGTVRSLYGKSTKENCVHSSDSEESAEKEIALWFSL